MSGSSSNQVERLEPWQLAGYLELLARRGVAEVSWNRERITLAVARERASAVSQTATVVVDGTALYVAEPDHSPDEAPRIVPIQLGPRRR